MSPLVIAVVLLAALLHASWNVLVKTGEDRALDGLLVAVGAAAIAAPVLLVLPAPARASLPFLLVSAAIHTVYFALLARAYDAGDFGPSYTLMRGTAPVLTTAATAAAGGIEAIGPATWLGVAVVSAGVLATGLLSVGRRGLPPRALGFALANAVVIAAYTVVDGVGVRRSGAPLAYTAGVFVLDAIPLLAIALARRGGAGLRHARRAWPRAAVGGAFTVAAYALTLWAMTRAPIAAVAALRETSVIFGALLATWRLRGAFGAGRVGAAAVVALGVALLR